MKQKFALVLMLVLAVCLRGLPVAAMTGHTGGMAASTTAAVHAECHDGMFGETTDAVALAVTGEPSSCQIACDLASVAALPSMARATLVSASLLPHPTVRRLPIGLAPPPEQQPPIL